MKRIVSVIVALCICTTLFVGITAAATDTQITYWDGTKPTSIVDSGMTGSGTESDPYMITNGAQLYAMAKTAGNGGSYFKLANDIYLNQNYTDYASWNASTKPANIWDLGSTGSNNNSFSAITTSFNGVLDGDGYTVYGFYSNQDFYGSLIPLVNHIADDYDNPIVIKNLNMAYCTTVGGRNGAFILGGVLYRDTETVTIENCTVKNGYFYNPWTTNNTSIGAIVGDVNRNTVIRNCAVYDVQFKHNGTDQNNYSGYAAIAGNVNANLTANGAFNAAQAGALRIEDCYSVNVATTGGALLYPVGILYTGSAYSNTVTLFDVYTDGTEPVKNNVKLNYSTDGSTVAATNPVKTVAINDIKGEAAKAAMPGFDWAGKKWVTVANDLPVPHAKCNIVTDAAVAADCGKEGLTEGKHCSECGTVTVAQQTTDALTHDFSGSWTDVDGGGKIRECANNCGENEYYAQKQQDGINAVTGIDAVPTGSVLNIEQLKSGSVYEALGKTLGDTVKAYKAWDITALDATGGVVQVDGAVTLTFDIPEGFSKNIKVYYFDGADEVEEVAIKQQTATTVTVQAQHLSIYTIVDASVATSTTIPEGESDTTENTTGNEADLGIILNGDATAPGTTSPKTGESVAVVIVTLILLGCASFIFVKKLCK